MTESNQFWLALGAFILVAWVLAGIELLLEHRRAALSAVPRAGTTDSSMAPRPDEGSRTQVESGPHAVATTDGLIALCEASAVGAVEPAALAKRATEIAANLRQFVRSDDYLRAIRSEELDGSGRALGELLNENTQRLRGLPLARRAAP